ncbi:hypothetical protein A3I25_01325 [Candidatus Nomurabacteria bacterium RIFCSPLOWO2_02_FULL_42_17]|uniref:Pilus assembly protein PilO n=2 Tax=Candidatus Nomuraibacteriota TaxID=1752729 RepID=A0A1F6WH70_9BACT|nr:MAG: hypothetical protein UV08_C0006G0024 [Parcubacteria group bacterium GW2011_GWA2_42_18]OGI81260.1 MAG: hypothetical protein A3B93_00370 [Candidatus Nomurabacteria bacterium RIFCSPHIGHO2_02_FULL_42_24]OGI97347.1 MAG: hypothetical protein A3I25_01325 [Candidatus Nomurabacteria bacterium RIFCSPLOWO2_02_FULL_42_17]
MTRLFLPIILIGAAIGLFAVFTDSLYGEVKELSIEQDNYNTALSNSKQILKERDALVEKYNNFSEVDKEKLNKLLPDNVDNIRLIIELETLGLRDGMVLKDVKVESASGGKTQDLSGEEEEFVENLPSESKRDYSSMDISFSMDGTYQSFLKFISDLDKSLRMVDVQSIAFSSSSEKESAGAVYSFDFKIRTYWLKN